MDSHRATGQAVANKYLKNKVTGDFSLAAPVLYAHSSQKLPDRRRDRSEPQGGEEEGRSDRVQGGAIGRTRVSFVPANTASPSASIMPSCRPGRDGHRGSESARPSATVASWVLSPISARKNTTVVVSERPPAARAAHALRTRSGKSVQIPKAMKPRPRTHPSTARGEAARQPRRPTDEARA